ncbi:DUF5359 family protein [Bacillus sp. 1P06AnD]|uniref:DUF5359 family protein n=1 Tax=Bacillus sp. 1P06AnD TaxID=3132208 RepID=UPI0039A136AC
MEKIERLLVKLVLIQLAFLLFCQFIFHRPDAFAEWKKWARYEGVYLDNYDRIADVLKEQSSLYMEQE